MVGSQLWGFIASPFMLIFYATVGLFYTKTAQCKDTLSCSFEDDQFDSQGLPPRDSIQDYMDHVVKLIKGVVSGLLSEALGLSKDHLTSLGGYESQRLICHYYPACPEPHLTQGAMKHTDPYFLTVVTQDHLGGLQVLKDNQWLDVPPVEAALVINGGDFMQDFVKKVLETIELKGIKDSLVGTSGVSGLSHEQRKRLTISVELVANSSDIFLDEPTTGLDARSAAIVIRAVKNVAVTDRTIVCTIHQPSIDIFEAFDESIACVTEIKNNYNPATWMVEVSSAGSKQQRESKETKLAFSWIEKLGVPYHISSRCCRSPYNLFRLGFRLASSLIYGILLWEKGTKLENQQSLFSVFGSMYSAVIFCGICNCASVLPYVTTKRRVYYREKLAGMYESWAYSLAQVVIEIPYIFAQVVIFTGISYTMIGYYGSAYKVFWYMNTMFCSLLYFNYMGMTIIAITPSFHVAAVLQQSFYSMFNLFSAFMVPRLRVPNRWIWLYYITPSSLT